MVIGFRRGVCFREKARELGSRRDKRLSINFPGVAINRIPTRNHRVAGARNRALKQKWSFHRRPVNLAFSREIEKSATRGMFVHNASD